ncbi:MULTISPECIES: hypothetical protein [Actinomadura]|uniref:CU044_5270 family protein n=1 Tax=Actinomadura yumaensis TaxID=111807 RepID=A0ABW2CGG3_9ACTN|nr:hypothetical protein [Actinomadura sp. J1-007]MWK34836.1 hypothetical protein [Actinomadura sp. J1-007]
MDELTIVAEAFDEGGPSALEAADGRRRLEELMRPAVPEPRRRRWRPRLGVGLGLVAAATAAVLATASLGDGEGTPALSKERAAEQHVRARTFLLAAATRLESGTKPNPWTPPKPGRYWRQRTLRGQAWHVVSGGYVIYTEVRSDAWQPGTGQGRGHFAEKAEPVGPRTPEDVAAWRKAGSPTRWRAQADGDRLDLARDAAPPEPHRPVYILDPDTEPPSVPSRIATGADPAAFVAMARRDAGFVDGRANELMAGARYIGDKLAAPKSRAAVLRMLAGLSGIRSIGTVRDACGRTGIGLAAPWVERDDGSVVEYQLVLDPDTDNVLGDQMILKKPGKSGMRPGLRFDYTCTLTEGWTNETPH